MCLVKISETLKSNDKITEIYEEHPFAFIPTPTLLGNKPSFKCRRRNYFLETFFFLNLIMIDLSLVRFI